ncbi:hypothetical protein EDD86DRAFT_249865 [Gorgonomyces haynaldii]|nr:hypothetical protein EDD86DRAFT_249865 [Gorgonomyces haynaldii]
MQQQVRGLLALVQQKGDYFTIMEMQNKLDVKSMDMRTLSIWLESLSLLKPKPQKLMHSGLLNREWAGMKTKDYARILTAVGRMEPMPRKICGLLLEQAPKHIHVSNSIELARILYGTSRYNPKHRLLHLGFNRFKDIQPNLDTMWEVCFLVYSFRQLYPKNPLIFDLCEQSLDRVSILNDDNTSLLLQGLVHGQYHPQLLEQVIAHTRTVLNLETDLSLLIRTLHHLSLCSRIDSFLPLLQDRLHLLNPRQFCVFLEALDRQDTEIPPKVLEHILRDSKTLLDNPDAAVSRRIKRITSPTFYFRVGGEVPGCPSVQTFNDGQSYGPCNGGRGVKYGTAESKYYVAIRNAAQYCGQTITATFGSRQIQLKVMDECPGCAKDNHLDMSLEALIELTGSKEIACAINRMPPMINWNFGGKPQDQPVHTPTSTDDEKPTESAKHTTKSAISTVTSLATNKVTYKD